MDPELWKDYLRPYYLKWFYHRLHPEQRAGYLEECWKRPHFPVNGKLRELSEGDPAQPDILFLPMSDWHTRIQRTQHLAMNFAAMGARCFYLNPHLGRQFPKPYSRRDHLRAGLLGSRTVELHLHLPREPIYHHRLLTPDENERIVEGIERLAQAAGVRSMIQFVSFPLWSEAAREIKRRLGFPIVYDCHDLLGGFSAISKNILEAESGLLESADKVCFSSQLLLDKAVAERPSLAAKSGVVRNAVNLADYAGTAPRRRAGQPTIGYAGSLDFWFDIEAVALAAERHPEWSFLLIGRVESARFSRLESLPNVTLAGEVPYQELAARLAEIDVAMIPFEKIPLTLATNPLKLYEYLSLGIPIVSTRLPEIEPFHELVYLSDSPQQFVQRLEEAVAERDPGLSERRKQAAAANTWRVRCEELRSQFPKL